MPRPREHDLVGISNAGLRQEYLADGLFERGKLGWRQFPHDRILVAGAIPVDTPLLVESDADLSRALAVREAGVINLGAPGVIRIASGDEFTIARGDVLYLGLHDDIVSFEPSESEASPVFYLVACPAQRHASSKLIPEADVEPVVLGEQRTANRRSIRQYITPDRVDSAQLMMGMTRLEEGSVWNTMPPHTHQRRTEVYLYFDLEPSGMVMHTMGAPTETRTLPIRNLEAVISPGWSVHFGAGTSAYSFIWAMAGENDDYSDVVPVDTSTLS